MSRKTVIQMSLSNILSPTFNEFRLFLPPSIISVLLCVPFPKKLTSYFSNQTLFLCLFLLTVNTGNTFVPILRFLVLVCGIIVLGQVLDQLCTSANSNESETPSSSHRLPADATRNLSSNSICQGDINHTSQDINFKSQSATNCGNPFKRSILYEHLLKDISPASKNATTTLNEINKSNNFFNRSDNDLALIESYHKSAITPATESFINNKPISLTKEDRLSLNTSDDGIVDDHIEQTNSKIMNLSKKSSFANDEDSAVPLNLCVKKAASSSARTEGNSTHNPLGVNVLVNNLVSSNHHQTTNSSFSQQINPIVPQQKKRGRKPKALINHAEQLSNFAEIANSFFANNSLSQSSAHNSQQFNNVNLDVKPRKRGRPPTLSPTHNSIAANTSNLTKVNNTAGAFSASYPFNLFNTPSEVLSGWPGLNALTAAAAAAAAAASGNPFGNSQNPFNFLNKLNSKDINNFNLNLLNTNLFNLKKASQESEIVNKPPKVEKRVKEDNALLSASSSSNFSSKNIDQTSSVNKNSFAHKPHPNEKQIRIPLNHGWKRSTYITGFSKLGSIEGDVNYIAPCGKKIKNFPELIKYLTKNGISSMTRDNFSFDPNVIVGQFVENIQELGSEVTLTENQIKVQLEEMNKIRNFCIPSSSNQSQQNHSAPEKRKRVRDSGGTRNVYDSVKNFKSSSISYGNKNDIEPSITITIQNQPSSRGAKRKSIEQNKAEIARNEKLFKKQEEERKLRELKEKQELEERKLKEAQERQLELQKQEEMKLLAEIEQERAKQHQMFIHALSKLQKIETRKTMKEELNTELNALNERKILKKILEMEFMKEMKKPVEDLMLKDHKSLPTFNRIPGLKLTGKAFADALMVFEFLFNFGETIGFDTESLPNLNTLMMALLNLDKEAEDELMSIINHLVICAIEDPGMPTNATTAMGQKLKDATVTDHNVTEILRLYFQSFESIVMDEDRDNRIECKIYTELCSGIPFLSMNATSKLDILVFLCNELLCNQAIVKQIDDNIESVGTFKKDKWILENDIRKLRVIKLKREKITELENAKLQKEAAENGGDDTVNSDNEESSSTTTVPVASVLPSSTPEYDDDVNLTNEEIDKKVDKLNKQCNQMSNKMHKALNSYRVFPLGQDRFRRTYWVLPNCGGVFVEGIESCEPEELENNINDENENDLIEDQICTKTEQDLINNEELDMNDSQTIKVKTDEKSSDSLQDESVKKEDTNENEIVSEENKEVDEKPVKEEPTLTENNDEDVNKVKSEEDAKDEQNESFTDVNVDHLKWFDLEMSPKCEINNEVLKDTKDNKSELEDEDEDDEGDDDDTKNGEKDNFELEKCLEAFLDDQTIKCIFSETNKSPDDAIFKENIIRILSSFPKSAYTTKFNNIVNESDISVCPTLQKRVQIWKILQYDSPIKIPREFQLGWWRITDANQLKSMVELLHSNALRERNLQKHLIKHLNYAMQSCKNSTSNLDVNDYDREASESREHGAPTENMCPHKSCHEKGYCVEVSMRKDLEVLEQIEAFEEKILSASMQVRNWKPSNKVSSSDYKSKSASSINPNKAKTKSAKKKQKNTENIVDNECNENGINTCIENADSADSSDYDLLKIQKEKLLEIESVIERRYLKPPLGFKNNALLLSNSSNSDYANGDDYNEYATDDNATTGLLRWRDAVRDAKCSSQVAMCLHFLENCIAWDKSIMRASCQYCGSGENEAQLLLCDLCDKGYHMYCFKPKMDSVPAGDWFCFDCQNKNTIDKVCIVCGKKGKLLNCDTCAKVFHPNCLDPPMNKQLKGRWICHLCMRKNKRYSNSKSSSKKSISASDDKNADSNSGSNAKESKRVSNGNSKEKSEKDSKKDRKSKREEKEKNKKEDLPEDKSSAGSEIDLCKQILDEMEKHENSWPFLQPVNTKQFPTYKKIIKKPMDVATIKSRFDTNSYKTKEDFAADIRLIFDNCVTFNEDESPVGQAGHSLRAFFESKWDEIFGIN